MKQQQQQQYPHYAEALEPNAYYQQQQPTQLSTHNQRQQRQMQPHGPPHQLSSDEEQIESAAHAHLLHMQRRAGGQQLPPPPPHMAQYHHDFIATSAGGGVGGGAQQRYYRNKHSNCDLNQEYDPTRAGDAYYNQSGGGGSLAGDGGPVYEEILSNRNSDVQHYEVGDFDVDEVYNNSIGAGVVFNTRHGSGAGSRFGVAASGSSLSGNSIATRNAILQQQQQQQQQRQRRRPDVDDEVDDDDDEDVDEEEEHDDSVCDDDEAEEDESDIDDDSHGLPPQSDERMRRLMAIQDEDFKRRFQRQLRKNGAPIDYNAPPAHQAQQQHDAVFGVSGDVGEIGTNSAAIRGNFLNKKHAKSPSGRVAINELFSHGPPALPPANQKRHVQQQQQQQQQPQLHKISPQSTTSSSSHTTTTTSHNNTQQNQIQIQQQQHQPRNISAMLDENNTVRCYLEPLTK